MKKALALTSALILAGCASNPADNWQQYVTPKPDGLYSVDARGDSEDSAKQTALLIARAACTDSGGPLSVTKETTSYDGPQGVVKTMDSIFKASATLYAHNTGRSVGWYEDDHYKTSLEFRCQ
ncbi:MAG: hypothetical protein COB04_18430 [Gammaproteobacteria bacterium]|nr:MAG: hypothetical protein COB04_18430 [Gammaproteobacteria bacterium]